MLGAGNGKAKMIGKDRIKGINIPGSRNLSTVKQGKSCNRGNTGRNCVFECWRDVMVREDFPKRVKSE